MIARGPGPTWFRRVLVGLAVAYYVALLKRPPQLPGLHAVTFFSEATCLFPDAADYALEFRLEGWSCASHDWEPLDPGTYFPIEAESKESRFQRIGYFYQRSRPVMRALDAWVVARTSGIGGIRVIKLLRPIPDPDQPVERYHYQPLDPGKPDERKLVYMTLMRERAERCGGHA